MPWGCRFHFPCIMLEYKHLDIICLFSSEENRLRVLFGNRTLGEYLDIRRSGRRLKKTA
jgi:hypothetical protein